MKLIDQSGIQLEQKTNEASSWLCQCRKIYI